MTSLKTSLNDSLTYAVMAGSFIPAHDQTFDLAEEIAERLAAFHSYIVRVRDLAQADDALLELADAIKSAVYDLTRQRGVSA